MRSYTSLKRLEMSQLKGRATNTVFFIIIILKSQGKYYFIFT